MVLEKTDDFNCTQNKVTLAEKIFTEHGDFIHSVIRFQIKDIQQTEDLYQDIFLHLVAKPIPAEVREIRAFLYRVICYRAKDTIRKSKRHKHRLLKYANNKTEIVKKSPNDKVIQYEEIEKVFELINSKLPKREAMAVTLKYKYDFETSEVAKKMKLKPYTVSRYISVAVKKLRCAFGINKENPYDSK